MAFSRKVKFVCENGCTYELTRYSPFAEDCKYNYLFQEVLCRECAEGAAQIERIQNDEGEWLDVCVEMREEPDDNSSEEMAGCLKICGGD